MADWASLKVSRPFPCISAEGATGPGSLTRDIGFLTYNRLCGSPAGMDVLQRQLLGPSCSMHRSGAQPLRAQPCWGCNRLRQQTRPSCGLRPQSRLSITTYAAAAGTLSMAELEQRAAEEEEDSAPARQIQQPGKPDRGRSRRYKAMKAKVPGQNSHILLAMPWHTAAQAWSPATAVPVLHRSLPKPPTPWSPWRL